MVKQTLGANHILLQSFGFGNAAAGLRHLAFPVLDGSLNAVYLHLDGLLRSHQLIVVLTAEHFNELLAPGDFLLQSDHFGMLGPIDLAQFLPLNLEKLHLLPGSQLRIVGGGRAGGTRVFG